MAPGAARAAKPKRKRSRKTRTAIVSDASSSSSSSSDNSSSSSDEEKLPVSSKVVTAAKTPSSDSEYESESNDSSSSSSYSSYLPSQLSQSEKGEGRKGITRRDAHSPPPEIKQDFSDSSDEEEDGLTLDSKCRMLRPPTPVLRSELIEEAAKKRTEGLKIKNEKKATILAKQRQTASDSATREEDFQAVWMRMMVDEFGEELDALRKKEPNLTIEGGNRMPLLIDALQAGSEVFTRGADATTAGKGEIGSLESDEVGLMLWSKAKAS